MIITHSPKSYAPQKVMQARTRRWPLNRLLLLCAALIALCAALTLPGIIRNLRAEYGHMRLCILDAYTMQPVGAATIIIPECEKTAVSDEKGRVEFSGIPVLRANTSANLPQKSYGEVTIIVYADGYLPFVLFYAQVYPNRMRSGPNLYLFPCNTEDGISVVSMIESPDEGWVDSLMARYAPES